jgi:uncharacterized protein (DUF58 family)
MITPTKSGWGFLGLMFMLYLSSMQSQSGLLFFIIGILAACFVLNILKARNSLKKIKFQLPEKIKMVEGKQSTVTMEVENTSSQTQGIIDIIAKFGKVFRIGAIPQNSTCHLFPDITFPVRGVYPLSKLKIESTFPFGLMKIRKRISQKGSIVVVPAVYPCQSPPADGFEPMTGGTFTGKHKSQSGSEFAGVREFTPEDPIKFIHWKSSSKGRGLMVKEFNEELSGRISVIIDCTPTQPTAGETQLDRAVRAVGSLTLSALDVGHHVDIIPMSDKYIMKFPPFADGTALLDMLAGIEEKKNCMTKEDINDAVEIAARRSALCFVMTQPNKELDLIIEQLLDDRRKISVYIPEEEADNFYLTEEVKVYQYSHDRII